MKNVDVEFVLDEQRLRPSGSEVFRLGGDKTRIHELTGFEPLFDLRKRLQEIVDWFIPPSNLRRYKPGKYNV